MGPNGVLVVNKEPDMTSRDVVNILSRIFHTKKIGHTGTLDPMATGVLIACVGKSTKLVEILTAKDKTYVFEACLGVLTDTLDCTGTPLKEMNAMYSKEEIEESLAYFTKTYMQEVPKFSAVRIEGRKLYEYARNEEEVELPKREVTVFSSKLIGEPVQKDGHTYFKAEVCVSKGTYIRSLIRDIGAYLNTYGMMTSLERIKQGNISIEEAYSLKEIENGNFSFVSEEKIYTDFPSYELSEEEYSKVKHGMLLKRKGFEEKSLLKYQGEVIAIYQIYEKDETLMKPWKMLKSEV